MGCRASRYQVKKLREEEDVQPPSEFTLTLVKLSPQQSVGLGVVSEDGGTLRIEAVHAGGAVSAFMKSNADEVDSHVKVGYTILAVNDVMGDCEAMIQQFSAKVVVLTIQRTEAETDHHLLANGSLSARLGPPALTAVGLPVGEFAGAATPGVVAEAEEHGSQPDPDVQTSAAPQLVKGRPAAGAGDEAQTATDYVWSELSRPGCQDVLK
eukprot:TRINITY_DN17510_c0_g1_i2.p1 TRINITY_DN17510_c0_g1~~TRINITY_DN17510_c0_g1_i2.p1  ORF type:complete len:210 (+),score=40.48 TRINITY_DN17510_c0_g1_i2:145-774(+)